MDVQKLFEETLQPGATIRGQRAYYIDVPSTAPHKDETIAHDTSRWTLFRKRNADYLDKVLAPLSSQLRLLDIGTGPNQFKRITSRFTESLRADFKEYADVNVVADLSQVLPFKNESFDIVLSTNFLEHHPAPALSVSECHRIMKQDGYYIGIVPFLVGVHQRPYDFFRYTDIQLETMLNAAGFRDVVIEPLGSMHDAYRQLSRQFFQRMIGSETHPVRRLFWKCTWQAQRLLSGTANLLPPPHIDAPADRDYTLGYAWFARK